MELEIKKERSFKNNFQAIAGYISFLTGLLSLAGINISLLLEAQVFPGFIIQQLPGMGMVLGLLGLFTRRFPRLYAWWGIGINIFIYIFMFLMIGLAWTINPKP